MREREHGAVRLTCAIMVLAGALVPGCSDPAPVPVAPHAPLEILVPRPERPLPTGSTWVLRAKGGDASGAEFRFNGQAVARLRAPDYRLVIPTGKYPAGSYPVSLHAGSEVASSALRLHDATVEGPFQVLVFSARMEGRSGVDPAAPFNLLFSSPPASLPRDWSLMPLHGGSGAVPLDLQETAVPGFLRGIPRAPLARGEVYRLETGALGRLGDDEPLVPFITSFPVGPVSPGLLSGWVLSRDLAPAAGVTVRCGQRAAATDARGWFRLTGLEPGPRVAEIGSGASVLARETVTVLSGPATTWLTHPIVVGATVPTDPGVTGVTCRILVGAPGLLHPGRHGLLLTGGRWIVPRKLDASTFEARLPSADPAWYFWGQADGLLGRLPLRPTASAAASSPLTAAILLPGPEASTVGLRRYVDFAAGRVDTAPLWPPPGLVTDAPATPLEVAMAPRLEAAGFPVDRASIGAVRASMARALARFQAVALLSGNQGRTDGIHRLPPGPLEALGDLGDETFRELFLVKSSWNPAARLFLQPDRLPEVGTHFTLPLPEGMPGLRLLTTSPLVEQVILPAGMRAPPPGLHLSPRVGTGHVRLELRPTALLSDGSSAIASASLLQPLLERLARSTPEVVEVASFLPGSELEPETVTLRLRFRVPLDLRFLSSAPAIRLVPGRPDVAEPVIDPLVGKDGKTLTLRLLEPLPEECPFTLRIRGALLARPDDVELPFVTSIAAARTRRLRVEPARLVVDPDEIPPVLEWRLEGDDRPQIPGEVTWHSMDPSVVGVDPDGVLVLHGGGSAWVQARTGRGPVGWAQVTVPPGGLPGLGPSAPGAEEVSYRLAMKKGGDLLEIEGLKLPPKWRSHLGKVTLVLPAMADPVAVAFEVDAEGALQFPLDVSRFLEGPAGLVRLEFVRGRSGAGSRGAGRPLRLVIKVEMPPVTHVTFRGRTIDGTGRSQFSFYGEDIRRVMIRWLLRMSGEADRPVGGPEEVLAGAEIRVEALMPGSLGPRLLGSTTALQDGSFRVAAGLADSRLRVRLAARKRLPGVVLEGLTPWMELSSAGEVDLGPLPLFERDLYPVQTVPFLGLLVIALAFAPLRLRFRPFRAELAFNGLAIGILGHLVLNLPHQWVGMFGLSFPAGALMMGALMGQGLARHWPLPYFRRDEILRHGSVILLVFPLLFGISLVMCHGLRTLGLLLTTGELVEYSEGLISLYPVYVGRSLATGASFPVIAVTLGFAGVAAYFAWIWRMPRVECPTCQRVLPREGRFLIRRPAGRDRLRLILRLGEWTQHLKALGDLAPLSRRGLAAGHKKVDVAYCRSCFYTQVDLDATGADSRPGEDLHVMRGRPAVYAYDMLEQIVERLEKAEPGS